MKKPKTTQLAKAILESEKHRMLAEASIREADYIRHGSSSQFDKDQIIKFRLIASDLDKAIKRL